jgi:acyl-CoA synthetase (AMP-forming)/AMP-acid ligase II
MLTALLDGPARWSPERPAIVVGDRPARTWHTLADAVARRGAGLRERFGLAPGEAVGLFAGNCEEYLEILFSVWHAGAIAVPISSRLHAREASQLLASSGARVCFTAHDTADALLAHAPAQTRVVVIGDREDAALSAREPRPPVPRSLADDAWIFFTSGTTGRAKGARLTHGNLLAMTGAYLADVSEVGPRDSIVHVAALSHAAGLFSLPFLGRGAAQVLPVSGHFDAAELQTLVGDEERLASVGVARFGTRVRVVDEQDRPLRIGEVGEVVVDGPTVMAGYLDMPEESKTTLRGGWLHTGDLGRFDDRGHLTLVDRVKDVIITGGYNVYPSEVENVLLSEPALAEAAVIGVPDEEWGERVVAYVVPRAGAEVDAAALDARCLQAIARHKRPKDYRVVDELPRNAAGKVLKTELKRRHLAGGPSHASR